MPVVEFCRSPGCCGHTWCWLLWSSEAAFCLSSWPLVNAMTLRVGLDSVGFFFLFHLCPLECSSFLVFKMVRALVWKALCDCGGCCCCWKCQVSLRFLPSVIAGTRATGAQMGAVPGLLRKQEQEPVSESDIPQTLWRTCLGRIGDSYQELADENGFGHNSGLCSGSPMIFVVGFRKFIQR